MRFTQSVVGVIALLALILTPLAPTSRSGSIALAQTPDPPARVGRLNYLSGQVSFAPGGMNEWAPAILNYPLTTGTALWTDDNARAEFHVGSTAIRMDQTTEVDILNLDDQTTQLRVPQGTVDIGLHQLAAGEQFEVDTPSAAITLVRAGRYRVAIDENQSTRITVWSGQVDVATSSQSFVVNTGQTAIISDNNVSPYQIVPTAGLDAFGQWSLARWQRETQALQVATQYVPATMTGFEDMAYYGTWRTAGGYGNAWFPRVQSDWAPYRHGRWVYVSPWGWTWIDNAPWGFAPSHYGRWILIGGQWAWIPGPVASRPIFAPALVVFVVLTGGGVGWFPLAPREVYVPPYYVSPTYYRTINITVVNVTVVNVTNVTYVYRHLPRAVTVVRQEAFLRSDPVARSIMVVRKPEIDNARVAASASPQPTLPSMLGHSGPAVAHRPPAALQERAVVIRTIPPTPVAPPAVIQRVRVRTAPVKPAADSRRTPAPTPRSLATTPQPAQTQPARPSPRSTRTAPQTVAPTSIPSQRAVPTPRSRPTPQSVQPTQPAAPQPTPRAPQTVAPTPIPSQPPAPTPRSRPTPQSVQPTQPAAPQPTPTVAQTVAPTPIPSQPQVPTPRSRQTPQPVQPTQPITPQPTPRAPQTVAPTPIPSQPPAPTPRSRPTPRPRPTPHPRPTPTPTGAR